MNSAQRAEYQLRVVEIAYRHRSPAMEASELDRLRIRSEAILYAMPASPDPAFRERLRRFRLELRPVG